MTVPSCISVQMQNNYETNKNTLAHWGIHWFLIYDVSVTNMSAKANVLFFHSFQQIFTWTRCFCGIINFTPNHLQSIHLRLLSYFSVCIMRSSLCKSLFALFAPATLYAVSSQNSLYGRKRRTGRGETRGEREKNGWGGGDAGCSLVSQFKK